MALAVFKTVVSRTAGWVGSTPIRLRHGMNVINSQPPLPNDPRRALPSVDEWLHLDSACSLLRKHPRAMVLEAVRKALSAARKSAAGGHPLPEPAVLAEQIENALQNTDRDRLRPVVNATGILLHTGLGRAVLPSAAVKALSALDRCVNLQIDLDTGLRGKRCAATESLICRLTGAEAALVVNNNAAATLLALAALCKDREVIVSRGQLIEIGGSFRLPDCIHQSGARLVETGTTNKTHPSDYAAALSDDTGAILRVNPSNYRVTGFTSSVPVAELAGLASRFNARSSSADHQHAAAGHESCVSPAPSAHPPRHEVIVIDDLGSGALIDPRIFGLPSEPTVPQSISDGADLVLFSGDKLIGGPQSGIIAGRLKLVQRIRRHPLTRMLRIDKLTDMALQHALRLFLDPETLTEYHPTLRMLTRPVTDLSNAAGRIRRRLAHSAPGLELETQRGKSAVGGGAFPGYEIPTVQLALRLPGLSPETLSRRLRCNEPPVIARIRNQRVILDLRTLMDGDGKIVIEALTRIASTC